MFTRSTGIYIYIYVFSRVAVPILLARAKPLWCGKDVQNRSREKRQEKDPPPELSTADAGMREEMCVCVCGRSTC